MTSTEKRLQSFAKLVNEYCKATNNEIIKSSLEDKMANEAYEIVNEFAEKEKNDGRKKKTE